MIGLDQEPSRETLDGLNRVLGEGQYRVEYRQDPGAVVAVIRTYEQPPRTWEARFATGAQRTDVDAGWRELVARVGNEGATPGSAPAEIGGGEVAPASSEDPAELAEAERFAAADADEERLNIPGTVAHPAPAPGDEPATVDEPTTGATAEEDRGGRR